MEYKQFFLKAFEQEPGKWRASVQRLDGKPLMISGRERTKLQRFVTGTDAVSAENALLMAVHAVDAGTFSQRRLAGEDARGRGHD
jgi:hypothetical protein